MYSIYFYLFFQSQGYPAVSRHPHRGQKAKTLGTSTSQSAKWDHGAHPPRPLPFFFLVPGQLCFLLEDPCLGQCERTNIWLFVLFFLCVCACNISKAPPPIVGDRCNSEVGSRALHNLPCSQIFRCCWLIHFVALRAPLEASLSVGRTDKLHKILPELDLASHHGAVGNRRGTEII